MLPVPKMKPSNILKLANDWILLMDEEHQQIVFPPEITETAKRPDIVIFSTRTKNVIIIELTVPMEENLASAYDRKKCKYQDLVADCENRGWSTYYFPIEVGSRGFCNTSVNTCLTALGIPKGKKKTITDTAAKIALRASYVIWLSRNSKAFRQMELQATPSMCSEGSVMVEASQTRFNPPMSGPKSRDLRVR